MTDTPNTTGQGKCARVVMIDDNSLDRDQVHFALRKLRPNVEFLSYDAPSDFLIDLDEGRISPEDLLILDINMPRISGYDLLRSIRERSGMEAMTAVILSGSDRRVDRTEAFGLGAAAFYTKPLKLAGYIQICGDIIRFLKH